MEHAVTENYHLTGAASQTIVLDGALGRDGSQPAGVGIGCCSASAGSRRQRRELVLEELAVGLRWRQRDGALVGRDRSGAITYPPQ